MSTGSSTQALAEKRAAPAPLVWRHWPLTDGGWQRVFVPATMLALSGATWLTTDSLGWAATIAALSALSFWSFFLPTTYTLDRHGVGHAVWGRQRTIAWRMIRDCELSADGFWMTIGAAGRPAAWWRRRYIPCRAHQDEVAGWLKHQFGSSPSSQWK